MAAVWNEDVLIEVEALQATYSDELVLNESQQQVSMVIVPMHDDGQPQYVQCQLLLTLTSQYPNEPPIIELLDVKGFTARQDQLQQQLVSETSELAGELLLGLLFESAKTWLTEHNLPEGPCIFCLMELAPTACSSSSSSSSPHTANTHACSRQQEQQQQQLMRLPCFHAFHESCFADWWCWQQQAYVQQQQALEAKTGATAAAALVQEALPAKDGQYYQLSCPTCRASFQLKDLQQHMQQQLEQGCQQQQELPEAVKLTAAQVQPFLELQQRHARLFAAQRQRQGIIATDTSYCIADWQGPNTSADTAAAPAPISSAGTGTAAAANSSRDSAKSSSSSGRGRGRGGGRWGRGEGGGHHRPRHSQGHHNVQHQQHAGNEQQVAQQRQQAAPKQMPAQQAQQADHQLLPQQQQQQQSWRGGGRGRGRGRGGRQQAAQL